MSMVLIITSLQHNYVQNNERKPSKLLLLMKKILSWTLIAFGSYQGTYMIATFSKLLINITIKLNLLNNVFFMTNVTVPYCKMVINYACSYFHKRYAHISHIHGQYELVFEFMVLTSII